MPTTAIGYGEAAKLLQQLDGPEAPAAWQGGLKNPKWAEFGITPAFTYHMGGTSKTQAHMKLDIEYGIKPMWNIVVTIPGKVHPEQAVVVGAHRDGWAYGTSDSTSGYIVTMEIAAALKQLMDQGWQPDRTIILAGWDGEEYGLLGSTEWVEEFAQQLGKDCVGYINLDGAGRRAILRRFSRARARPTGVRRGEARKSRVRPEIRCTMTRVRAFRQ